MSVVYRNLPTNGVSQISLKVRFAPQFVSRFNTRAQRHSPLARGEITGLLYGNSEDSIVTVQAFKSFPERSPHNDKPVSARERLAEAFESLLTVSRTDPEVSSLSVVGWYCIRPAGGLLGGDVDFHNLNFYQPTDIALVARPDTGTDLLLEIYSRSVDSLLSPEDHLWGALRIETGTTVAGIIEVTMRGKINDDFYLRAYGIQNEADFTGALPYWRRALASTARTINALKPKRTASGPKSTTAKLPEPIGAPPAPRTLAQPLPSAAAQQTDLRQQAEEGQQAYEAALKTATRTATAQPFQINPVTNELVTRPQPAPVLNHIHAGDPPGVPALRRQSRPTIPWVSSALIFALAAGCTFALVYSRGLPGGLSLPEFLKPAPPNTALGMRLDSQGERLLLSWNRSNPTVSSAQGGILRIDDGPRHREVHLDAAQVVNGSVLYRPNSDDVTFRLEVHSKQGNTISESIRVLDSQSAVKTLDLSEPTLSNPKGAPKQSEAKPGLPAIKTGREEAQIRREPKPIMQPNPQSKAPPPALVPRAEELARADRTRNVVDQRATQPAVTPVAETSSTPATATIAIKETAPAAMPVDTKPQAAEPKPTVTQATQPPLNNEPLSPKPERVVQPTAPVAPAAVYIPPQPLKQVLPNSQFVPLTALLNSPRLEVMVQVDAKGKVTAAQIGSNDKVNPALASAGISAAKQWRFKPATLRGQAVPSQHTIVFQFQSRR